MSSTIERYLLAEKAGSEGVWDWDLRNDTMFLSPRFKEFLGLPPGDVNRPEDWLDRVHPEDIDWLYASFEGQMVGVSLPFQIEHRVRRAGAPTGEGEDRWRWLVCRGMAVMDETGDPVRLVGSVSDITDRKHAERQLRKSEERYALAAAASNDGLYDWDLAEGTVYYSPRWKSLLGFEDGAIGNSPDEWLGRVAPEDQPALHAALGALGGDETAFQIEYRMRHADGGIRWMSCRGIAVLGPDGKPVRLVGSQADVTDRKSAEQRLRQSEERYALAAAGANDGLWDWRLDTGEVYYSPRWKAMLGFAKSNLSNSVAEWFDRVLPDDLDNLKTAIELHLIGEREHLQHEFRIRAADGSALWMLVRGLAVRDETGRGGGSDGSMTDVTAQKKAEQQLLFRLLLRGDVGHRTGDSNRRFDDRRHRAEEGGTAAAVRRLPRRDDRAAQPHAAARPHRAGAGP
ncbi:PAS domain-containing protein [Azospirillum sp. sgz302134]